jgi:C-terminal processing protease CtpA/Prc
MKKFLYTLMAIASLALTSCEKILFEEDKASTDPLTNFEYLWSEVDKKYSYFDIKGIDWDAVKQRYQDSIRTDMSEEVLFRILGAMLNELRDDHTNLVSPFNVSVYNVALKHEPNYYERTVLEYYMPNKQYMYTGAFSHNFIGDTIAYIRYGSFMSAVTNEDLDFILTRYHSRAICRNTNSCGLFADTQWAGTQ